VTDYEEYLASDWWRSRRDTALKRALYRCQAPDCRLDYLRSLTDWELRVEEDERLPPHAYRLEVHHLTYANLGREEPDDLIVLCPACHAAEHGLQHDDEPFTKSLNEAIAGAVEEMAEAFAATPMHSEVRRGDPELRTHLDA